MAHARVTCVQELSEDVSAAMSAGAARAASLLSSLKLTGRTPSAKKLAQEEPSAGTHYYIPGLLCGILLQSAVQDAETKFCGMMQWRRS